MRWSWLPLHFLPLALLLIPRFLLVFTCAKHIFPSGPLLLFIFYLKQSPNSRVNFHSSMFHFIQVFTKISALRRGLSCLFHLYINSFYLHLLTLSCFVFFIALLYYRFICLSVPTEYMTLICTDLICFVDLCMITINRC